MEIKPCPCCGSGAMLWNKDRKILSYFVQCDACGLKTEPRARKESAIDIWNSRVEQPSEADRWLKEATEQRARADLLEMQRDEFAEALEQAKKMLALAGRLQ